MAKVNVISNLRFAATCADIFAEYGFNQATKKVGKKIRKILLKRVVNGNFVPKMTAMLEGYSVYSPDSTEAAAFDAVLVTIAGEDAEHYCRVVGSQSEVWQDAPVNDDYVKMSELIKHDFLLTSAEDFYKGVRYNINFGRDGISPDMHELDDVYKVLCGSSLSELLEKYIYPDGNDDASDEINIGPHHSFPNIKLPHSVEDIIYRKKADGYLMDDLTSMVQNLYGDREITEEQMHKMVELYWHDEDCNVPMNDTLEKVVEKVLGKED